MTKRRSWDHSFPAYSAISKHSEVDTEGVPATAHPHDAAMPLRADIVTNVNRREELQSPAPKTESGLYIVPKVIE